MVAAAVKNVAYRSVKIFFNELRKFGESHLGIYNLPGWSEIIYLEHFPDEAILRWVPARVDAFGKRLSGTTFPLAFIPLSRLPLFPRSPRPLGSV